MLALGVIIVSPPPPSRVPGPRALQELLGITPPGIIVQAAAALVLAVVTFVLRRPFLLLCFDAEQASVSGVRALRNRLAMIALTIVVSFQTVGTLLVFGMLLAPAAASALVTRRLLPMMAIASLIGALSVYAGLLASYHFDLAAGAAITLTATAVFFAAFAVSRISRRKA
jgi:ABC-type Mn2+/Zn2+ transport system permease subunit